MNEHSGSGAQRTARRRAAAFACAAGLLVALPGCSSGNNPKPDPIEPGTSAASTTPSRTPSPSGAPTLPPQARGTSDKAAIAFVDHVIQVLNYSARTLETKPLSQLASPDCAACEAIVRTTKDIQMGGGRISGGAWTAVEAEALTGSGTGLRQVQTVVDYAAQTVFEGKETNNPKKYPAGRTVYIFDIRPAGEGWTLLAIRGGAS